MNVKPLAQKDALKLLDSADYQSLVHIFRQFQTSLLTDLGRDKPCLHHMRPYHRGLPLPI